MAPTDLTPARDPDAAQRRHDDILRAAIAHFGQHGFTNADLDAIAAEVGCAKGTLYRYFESKRDLFRQSVDHVMKGMVAAATACDDCDPVHRLEHAIRAYLAYFDEHPQYIELLIQERAEFKDREKPTYGEYRAKGCEHWRQVFVQAMETGRFRPMDPDRVFELIGNTLYGTIFTHHFAGRATSLREQANDVVDLLLYGLLSPEEAQARRARGSHAARVDRSEDPPP